MADEALVQAVKDIVGRAKAGDVDGSYQGYLELFTSPAFGTYRVEDQRQALRLMIVRKGPAPAATPILLEAHRAALKVLAETVAAHGDPADHELLGVCHVVLGDEATASEVFKAGLAIERERNASSELCGTLMKRVSML